MRKLDFKNKWVLVTGASSGLGEEMARQLAHRHQANLVLLARRADKLEKLQLELQTATNVKVLVMVVDLSDPAATDRAAENLLNEVDFYAAILNAGITYFGPNSALDASRFQAMLQTNVISTTKLTDRLVAYFENKNTEGAIMLVSSMAAIFPIPYQAVYSGTKAFLLAYAAALSEELTNKNLSITAFLPGGIATEMTSDHEFDDLKNWLMPVKQVAKDGIYALLNRKRTHIPGFLNRLGNILIPLLPQKFIAQKMSSVYRRSLIKAGLLSRNAK